jgi:hypothetical protein
MSFADASFSQSVQTGYKAYLVSCPKDVVDRFVKLNTHFYVVSRLRIGGAITQLPRMD